MPHRVGVPLGARLPVNQVAGAHPLVRPTVARAVPEAVASQVVAVRAGAVPLVASRVVAVQAMDRASAAVGSRKRRRNR